MERDEENNKTLLVMGWNVVRFWGDGITNDVYKCEKVIEELVFDQMINESPALYDNT